MMLSPPTQTDKSIHKIVLFLKNLGNPVPVVMSKASLFAVLLVIWKLYHSPLISGIQAWITARAYPLSLTV